jgi:hypothetical protein
MSSTKEAAIAALLREAASAHAEYEATVLQGVRDEVWPAWYAAWLLDNGLPNLLPRDRNVDNARLAALLAQFDTEYQQERPKSEWPEFYAVRLLTILP